MHLVKYYMNLCQPCKELDKALLTLDLGSITYENRDIYEEPRLKLQNLGIRGVPTMVLYADDSCEVEIKRSTGSMSPARLKAWLGLDDD